MDTISKVFTSFISHFKIYFLAVPPARNSEQSRLKIIRRISSKKCLVCVQNVWGTLLGISLWSCAQDSVKSETQNWWRKRYSDWLDVRNQVQRFLHSVRSGCWSPNTAVQLWSWRYLSSKELDAKEGISAALHRDIVSIAHRCSALHDRRFTRCPQFLLLPAPVFWALGHHPPSVTTNINSVLIMFPFL